MSRLSNPVLSPDSIIITSDSPDKAELFFYDSKDVLKHIVAKTTFSSRDEALEYAARRSLVGQVITVLENGEYAAFLIQNDGTLSPVGSGSTSGGSSHSHQNMTLLDAITQERMDKWDSGSGGGLIQSILLGGHALDIKNGVVDIPMALAQRLGVVRGTDVENGISINADGTMVVNTLNINKLVQTLGDEIIFRCGDAD